LPPAHDYSKEIDALFSSPSGTSAPSPVSTQQLKLETERLRSQLNSMNFTETHSSTSSVSAAPPPAPPAALKLVPPANTSANKVVDEPKISSIPARAATPSAISSDDQEVRIPAWLAPLSQNSETAVAEAASHVSAEPAEVSASSEALPSIDSTSSTRPETAVFGGQLLSDSTETQNASGGSKTGLWIGLAAAAVVLVAGGAWFARSDSASKKPASPVAAAAPSTPSHAVADSNASNVPPSSTNPTPVPTVSTPAPTPSQPVRKPESAAVLSAPARDVRNAEEAKKSAAAPPPAAAPIEEEKKSGLGDVHLATPVVNHGSAAEQNNDALPSIETARPASGEGLASGNQPAAPLPVGGEVQPAQLLKTVPPVYPLMAKTEHISGAVQIDALIDTSGNVAQLKVLSGPALLHRAALDAVKQWKYKPAMLDGQPTSMHLTVTVQFRAQ
jgi:periplasmic protein TonB